MRKKKRLSASKLIALAVLAIDAYSTFYTLSLCRMAIQAQFAGALPYLTTLIGALQAATAVVLAAYFGKSKCENTKGGITYETALGGGNESGI